MAMVAIMKTFHSRRTTTNNLHETPNFLISRDCHKSIFDGLQLTNAGATLLPCLVDPVFKVSLGPTIETISAAIMQSNDKPVG
jgi:arginine/lysine/ornithine decarboxylase